ncbi:unnamed protein product [Rotaria sp. Silwood2]|nr:unnamed protein product [Rotaria sp. Silwood2]CAF2995370.1 unnamed protein product [Rotaria sp. Silwood2]CAF3324576.1 unnamed protein product [Rotaria sp. Silwood2]CAF4149362.1 unnamed protein product [Rotaria sp. Silwood2]CAF4287009.1 unnamed protein product [Rotaria sp. Silwood2]
MSGGDKRKLDSLDSFVTITKKSIVTPSSPKQTESDQSALINAEVTETIDVEFEEPDTLNSSDINQNLNVIDSHPSTHEIDIGFQLSLRTTLTNETKYQLLTKPFRPDKKYKFPDQREKGAASRRFMATWLDQHSFLVYSPYYEGAYCSACSLFSPLASYKSNVLFVNYPCSRFGHLKHFSKYIKTHLNSKNHKLAMIRATEFIRTFENPTSSIDYQLDRNRIELIEKNKSILLSVIKVVITCARQNISIRGHRSEDIISIREHLDTVDASSGSNFIALLKQRIDAGDQILQSHLENGNRNSTYTSSSIQNKIIELIHEHVLSSILCRLGPTTLYSIIVDGTTDSSNIEQLCFLIRYVDQHSLEIREDFLAFIPTTSSTGEAIADHILSCLKKFGLPLTNCIGQAYDGAPCMSGIFIGCQAIIKRLCPDAEYMHCSSHAFNLALIDSSSSHFIRNMYGIVKSIITFFNDSPKRSNALKYEIERPDNDYLVLSKKKRLLSLCETRWVERNIAIETFLELYIPISNTLDTLRIGGDSTSQQLYHPINCFETIISTCIACFLLGEVTPLSRLLQTPTIDFGIAHHHVLSLLKTFDTREADMVNYFKNIVFEQAKKIAKELLIQPTAPRTYQRRHGQDILDPEEFYRDQVFLPFLRELKGNIEKRLSIFNQVRI